MASAQKGQSNAQKSMRTTLPRSASNLSGLELIQVSPPLSSGAFWPAKISSGCCAQAAAVMSNRTSSSFRSIVSSLQDGEYSVITGIFGRFLALSTGVENVVRTKAALRIFLDRGLGLRSANILIKHFKEPERALDSSRHELEALGV